MNPASPRRIRELSVSFALTALSTAAAVHAQPRIIYADASAPTGGNGQSWQLAFRDLQDALDAANRAPERPSSGVEIRIAQGVYTPDRSTGLRDLPFVPASAVTLMGGFAGLRGPDSNQRDLNRFVSVLSGDLAHNDASFAFYGENSRRLMVTTGAGRVVLDGLTFSGASGDATPPDPGEAGIALQTGQAVVRNCAFVSNVSDLESFAGIPIIYLGVGTLMENCRVEGNISAFQSIIRVESQVTIRSCTVRGNRLLGTGPFEGRPAIIEIIGGVPGSSVIRSCLIADNQSGTLGISAPYQLATLELDNCTVVNNTAAFAPGLWVGDNTTTLRNCIFAGNVSTSASYPAHQIYQAYGPHLQIPSPVLIDTGASAVYPATGTNTANIFTANPLFASAAGFDGSAATWQDNDYHLRAGSPAIDRADATDPAFSSGYTDLDGRPLYDDPRTPNLGFGFVSFADLGCFEFQCPGDFNGSGAISPQDLFDFLALWFSHDPRADFDHSGSITVQDLFNFLTAWFGGC